MLCSQKRWIYLMHQSREKFEQHSMVLALPCRMQPFNFCSIATLSIRASSQPPSTQPSHHSKLCKSTRQLILQPPR